jgi:outer membrane biosynthesis protein TonB
MTVIKLPKTPKSAFNPRRPASALLLSQIEHLEHAVGLEPKRVKRSEGDAARYIAKLTAELLKQAQTPAAPAPSPLAGAVPTAAAPSPTVTQPIVPPVQIPVGTKKVGTKHHVMPVAKKAPKKPAKKVAKKAPKKTSAARRRGKR